MTTNGALGNWKVLLAIGFLIASSSFSAIQWQQAEAEIRNAEAAIAKLEDDMDKTTVKLDEHHEVDIARLDESNRNRRNQIADLEERIARLEERTS